MQSPTLLLRILKTDPTTSFILGTCLQALLITFLPLRLALLPPAFLLATKLLLMKTLSPPQNQIPPPTSSSQNQVLQGRWTAQLPREDGSDSIHGSETEVLFFVLGASSNHPQGKAAPGFKEVGQWLQSMFKELEMDPHKAGFLGRASGLTGSTPDTQNTVIVLSYWKNLDSLRSFAQGPAHRAGWDWWNSITKSHPHLGIMHEVYVAPRGHWENVYVNMRPFGMGQIKLPGGGEGPDRFQSALVRAKGAKWKSMLGRMSRDDGFEGYKAEGE